ncbi:hypothetical protein [Spirosoma koreense]
MKKTVSMAACPAERISLNSQAQYSVPRPGHQRQPTAGSADRYEMA